MDILKLFIESITNNIFIDFNKSMKKKKEQLKIVEMNTVKSINILVFSICFLMGNFTSMITILFKESLGYGIIFPLISAIFLYLIAITSLTSAYLSNKEKKFFIKKIEYDKKEELNKE